MPDAVILSRDTVVAAVRVKVRTVSKDKADGLQLVIVVSPEFTSSGANAQLLTLWGRFKLSKVEVQGAQALSIYIAANAVIGSNRGGSHDSHGEKEQVKHFHGMEVLERSENFSKRLFNRY